MFKILYTQQLTNQVWNLLEMTSFNFFMTEKTNWQKPITYFHEFIYLYYHIYL